MGVHILEADHVNTHYSWIALETEAPHVVGAVEDEGWNW